MRSQGVGRGQAKWEIIQLHNVVYFLDRIEDSRPRFTYGIRAWQVCFKSFD